MKTTFTHIPSTLASRHKFRRMLLESLENRQLMASDVQIFEVPSKLPLDESVPEIRSQSGVQSTDTPTYRGGVTENVILDGSSGINWDKTLPQVMDTAVEAVSLIGMFAGKSSPGFDPNKPVKAVSSQDNEVLYGSVKADQFTVVNRNVIIIGGPGEDKVDINAPHTVVMTGQGSDDISFGSYGGVGMGGPGQDKYRLQLSAYDNRIIDTSSLNEINIDVKLRDLEFGWWSKNTVKIVQDGRDRVYLQAPDFRKQEFVLKTRDATVPLSKVYQIPDRDAVQLAISAYKENGDKYKDIIAKSGYSQNARIENVVTGLEMTIHKRDFVPAQLGDLVTDKVPIETQFVVSIAGTQDLRDFAVFGLAPDLQAKQIINEVEKLIRENPTSMITLLGHSGGGEMAQKAAQHLAIKYPKIQFNVVMLNSGGVLAKDAHLYNLDNLDMTLIRSEGDFLSDPSFNAARGMIIEGVRFPRVYPEQTEIITIPYSGSGPDYKTDPFGFFLFNHDAERILEYYNRQGLGILQSTTSSEVNLQSLNMNGPSAISFDLTKFPSKAMESIRAATEKLDSADLGEKIMIPEFERNFDFGSARFVQPGTLNVSPDMVYSAARGFGLKESANVRAGDEAIGNDWQRDYVIGSSIPFMVDLESGFYYLTLMTGSTRGLDHLRVYANSQSVAAIAHTSPREIKETTIRFFHGGGTLELELRDTGGTSNEAILNGLKIKRVAPWAPTPTVTNPDPSLTVIVPGYAEPVSFFDKVVASIEPVKKIVETVALLVTPAAPLGVMKIVQAAVTVAQSSKKLYDTWAAGETDVPEWVFTAQIASNYQNAMRGLPLQRLASKPILLTDLESMTNEEQQKLLRKTDTIIINAQKQLNDGVKPYGAFFDGVSDAAAYRKSIGRLTDQTYRVLANKGRAIDLANQNFQLDVQIIAEDFAVVAAREAIDRISKEGKMLSQKLGYVELVALNPIAVTKTDNPYIYRPEARPFNFFVQNFFETVTDVPSDFYKGPLDGVDGGAYHGVENGIVREFSASDPIGATRYRNFTKEGKPVSGQVEKISYNDLGLIAYANNDGYVSIVNSKQDKLLFQDRVTKAKPIDMQFSPDGKNLAVMSDQGNLIIINLSTRNFNSSTFPRNYEAGLKWLGSDRIAVVGSAGLIQIIPIGSNGSLGTTHRLRGMSNGVQDFWVAPASANEPIRILSIHQDRSVRVWSFSSTQTPTQLNSWMLPANHRVLDADVQRGILLVSNGSVAELMQIEGNQLVSKLTLSDLTSGARLTAGRLSADGTRFVIGGDDQQIRVYDLASALNRQRVLVTTFSSVMLTVRSFEMSSNAESIFVSYRDEEGGKIRDWNLAGDMRDELGLIGRIMSSEYDKAKMLPFIVMNKYSNQLRFHSRRDRSDLDALYGQEAKQKGWLFARPAAVDNAFSDEDFTSDIGSNLQPPKFQRVIGDMILGKKEVVELRQLAIDPEGGAVTYSVRSSNPGVVRASITGDQLMVEPIDEGSVTVTITASDGVLTSAINFKVTTNPAFDRQRFEQLRTELESIRQRQTQLRRDSEAVEKTIANLRGSIEKIEGDFADYRQRVNRLANDANNATAAVQTARTAITTLTQERQVASADATSARRSEDAAKREADATTAQLETARNAVNARQREFDSARNRFQTARASQREARREEMNAARSALDAATSDRNTKQQAAQAANARLTQAVDRRKLADNRVADIDTRLRRLDSTLNDALREETRSRQLLDQYRLRSSVLATQRDQLLTLVNKEQTIAATHTQTAVDLTKRMQTLVGNVENLRQSKWVRNIGIDAWEADELRTARRNLESIVSNIQASSQLFVRLSDRLKAVLL